MQHYTISDNNNEIFSLDTQNICNKLNEVVATSAESMEGNLFYFHNEKEFIGKPPDPRRAHKRRNYARALTSKHALVEIGINAGHSALLALSSNPTLVYYGIDLYNHAYTAGCTLVLKEVFGPRFNTFQGDSRDILPWMATHRLNIAPDVVHVDGGHGVSNCRTDISNSIRLAQRLRGTHLIVDDTAAPFIRAVVYEFISLGHLITETLGGSWEGNENYLGFIATHN